MVAHPCRTARTVSRSSTGWVFVTWEMLYWFFLGKARQTLSDRKWVSGTTNLNWIWNLILELRSSYPVTTTWQVWSVVSLVWRLCRHEIYFFLQKFVYISLAGTSSFAKLEIRFMTGLQFSDLARRSLLPPPSHDRWCADIFWKCQLDVLDTAGFSPSSVSLELHS